MQIFNATRPGYEEEVFAEVEDAVAVYDEMLEYAEFLDHGEVLNTEVPDVRDEGLLWSGLRLGDRALVRAVQLGGGQATEMLELWPGRSTPVTADRQGRTVVFSRSQAHRSPDPGPTGAPSVRKDP